jgi:arylsulfatase A
LEFTSIIRKIGFGAATASVALSACKYGNHKKDFKNPNIIFILVDDLGWKDTGYMGSKFYETSNIDRLAGKGMIFTQAYAACAVCSPTRASIMTGRYPARLGLTDWIHFLDPEAGIAAEKRQHPERYVGGTDSKVLCPPNPYWMNLEEITIAEALKTKGYVTCHIGKWHLGPETWFPEKQGFDYNYGGADLGQPPKYFDPYNRNNERPGIPTLSPRKEGEYLTDREADEAVNFIREHKDTTFFLNLWHYAVHTPIQAKQEIIEKYKNKEPDGSQKNPVYAAMIQSVDEALGKIVQTLEELNLTENTIIIFFSDNGGLVPVTSNDPLRIGKGYPYEGGIKEPMFVYWPKEVEAGSVCDVPVTSVDFFPTLCGISGIPLPGDRVIDGKNITPLLMQKGKFERETIFWHFPHYRGNIFPYSIIRKGDYKLIKRYDGKRFELFDLRNDLSEIADLSDSLPGKVNELNIVLERWLKETGARIPVPNPEYHEPEDEL